MEVSRRTFLVGSAAPALLAQQKKSGPGPNIVLILTEEIGSWLLGCFGNKEIRTPNIDLLARSGSRFQSHTTVIPTAAAGRAALLTGRTPRELGVEEAAGNAPAPERFRSEVLLSDLLASAGYECGYAGVWGLGEESKPQHGFRLWHTLAAGAPGFPPELITRGAVDFLEARKPEQPFFLVVSHPGPNAPYTGHAKKYDDLYAKTSFSTLNWLPASSSAVEGKQFLADHVASLRRYAAALSALDDQIPPLISVLDKKGIRDKTLVVFTSSSGLLAGRHGLWSVGRGSDPANLYSEGVETPMIWNWPGVVPVEGERTELAGSYDLFPSLCEAAKVTLPADRNLCGRSYLVPITNRPLPRKRPWRNLVFATYGNTEMVRDARFKLVLRGLGTGPNELYDMRADAREFTNQYQNAQFLSVRNSLTDSLRRWRETYV